MKSFKRFFQIFSSDTMCRLGAHRHRIEHIWYEGENKVKRTYVCADCGLDLLSRHWFWRWMDGDL